jgi:hypothetical protein
MSAAMASPPSFPSPRTTPALDPVPDEVAASSPPQDAGDDLMARLAALDIEHDHFGPPRDTTAESGQLQMPQPQSFTPRHTSYSAMLQARPGTPPKSSPPTFPNSPLALATPPRLHSSSSNPFLTAPPMLRTNSLPGATSNNLLPAARSASPIRSPKRVRSPFRHSSSEESFLTASSSTMSPEIPSISEDAELQITPRASAHPTTTNPYASLTFPRSLRRRPASPLRSVNTSRASSVPASPFPNQGGGGSSRFNETFPPDLPYYGRALSLSSSVPSTPTSARSRSPSISSLETIPDTPDAEALAVEEDRRQRDERRRIWDPYGGNNASSSGGTAIPRGGSFANRDKRKRWSVCGAEKISDLNLETIWED